MNRIILIILVIANAALLIWSSHNLYLLSDPTLNKVSNDAREKSPLIRQSVIIMEGYTAEQKRNNAEEIVSLYSNLATLLESLNKIVYESIDALYEYAYSYLAISILNMLLLSYLIYTSRHNKSLKRDRRPDGPPAT